jgi:hypothetical protein
MGIIIAIMVIIVIMAALMGLIITGIIADTAVITLAIKSWILPV